MHKIELQQNPYSRAICLSLPPCLSCHSQTFYVLSSDVNKTCQDQDQDSGSQDQDQDLHIFSRPRPRLFSQDQDFFFQDQDQDFTRTTEQVTISWSQNEQNSIHTTCIAVYEIKTVGLICKLTQKEQC